MQRFPLHSVHLAERLLQQHHFPSPSTSGSSCSTTILNPSISPDTSLLELGAGTGLLPIFLSKLFDSWTVTDQFDNLKLIERNLRLNSVRGVLVEEVDWVEVAARPVKAKGIVGGGGKNGMISGGGTEKLDKKEFDIVLAVDCVYNEALVKPLVATLNEYAIPGRTVVWILVEMRSADVVSDDDILVRDRPGSDIHCNLRCCHFRSFWISWKRGWQIRHGPLSDSDRKWWVIS